MKTSLGDHVDLDGWITPRVVDRTSVDLGDGHDVLFSARIKLLVDNTVACSKRQRRVKLALCIGRICCSDCKKNSQLMCRSLGAGCRRRKNKVG